MVSMASSSPRANALLRRGSRLAGRLNTDWFAVYVETPGESPNLIDAETQRHLHATIQKAKDLGAEVVRLKGRDPVAALLDFARSHNVGHIVIGRSGSSLVAAIASSIGHAPAGRRGRRLRSAHRVARHRGAEFMSLRLKLLLALLPLGLALVVVGVSAVWSLAALGTESQLILHQNYRSVLAAQRMQEAIERLDRAGDAAGHRPRRCRPLRSANLTKRFEAELNVQEGNITEPGEEEATATFGRASGRTFVEKLQEFQQSDRPRRDRKLLRRSIGTDARTRSERPPTKILTINQDAMLEKSDKAENFAAATNRALTVTTLAALAIGAAISIDADQPAAAPLGRAQPGRRPAGKRRLRRAGQGRRTRRNRPVGRSIQLHGRPLGRIPQQFAGRIAAWPSRRPKRQSTAFPIR